MYFMSGLGSSIASSEFVIFPQKRLGIALGEERVVNNHKGLEKKPPQLTNSFCKSLNCRVFNANLK